MHIQQKISGIEMFHLEAVLKEDYNDLQKLNYHIKPFYQKYIHF
jgi:hypothetical protein